jgi:hypothetical protein
MADSIRESSVVIKIQRLSRQIETFPIAAEQRDHPPAAPIGNLSHPDEKSEGQPAHGPATSLKPSAKAA